MAFLLHIRENLETAGDHFGPGQVRRFDAGTVRIGSGPSCECRIEDPAFAPCHLVLKGSGSPSSRVRACPREGATTFLNGQPLAGPTPLRSGDELRVGHWTLRFQRLYEPVRRSWQFHVMSRLAQGAVALVLALEVALVAWLPRRVTQAAFLEPEIARHRIGDLLDSLNRRNREGPSPTDFERTLRREIDRELRQRGAYLAQYGDRLRAADRQRLYEELRAYDRILSALADRTLPPPLPDVDVDGGVRALLGQTGKE